MEKNTNLMPEDVQRLLGKDAQSNNILAARMVAEVVKTTLGPKGMDKMLVSPTGEIIVTNDGVTILSEMQIEHPAAKMMVEIAKTQESEVGDGTTTAVMLAGRFLENAEKLLEQKIHPTVITKGYRLAAERAQEILKEISLRVTSEDIDILEQIAMTAMTGKGAEGSKEKFSKIIVSAVRQIENGGEIDLNDIKLEKVQSEGVKDTELVNGIVFSKSRLSLDMPTKVDSARIALVNFPIEVRNPELDAKISITSPSQLGGFIEEEERVIKEMIEKIKMSGANVLLCQKGVDDFAQYLLAKENIYACRRVSRSDLEKLSKATGAKIVSNLNELDLSLLGEASSVEEKFYGEEKMTYVCGCKNPKAVSILIHGGSIHVIDEIERAFMDGLGDVSSVLKSGLVVAGGGAVEMELSSRLRDFAKSFSGREQLAVFKFASALEFIPSTLAENAGLDPIDILTELKASHERGESNFGINLFNDKVENVLAAKIIEPYKIKSQAINSASEVAMMILRIDDVIASKPNKGGNMVSDGGNLPNMMGEF
jgi:archaeal chaperonin